MGSTNCKSADDVRSTIDYTYYFVYAQILIMVVTSFIPQLRAILTLPEIICGYGALYFMYNIGGLVECGIENSMLTADDVMDFGSWYLYWVIGIPVWNFTGFTPSIILLVYAGFVTLSLTWWILGFYIVAW